MRENKTICHGSGGRVMLSLGQTFQTGGAVKPNKARDVRCKVCNREFASARIAYTDHGIPTQGQGVIPRHTREVI